MKEKVILRNRDEIISQLEEILKKNDIEMPQYQEDIYLYIDEDGIGTLETFTNVGGNSWLNDDHYTVHCMNQHYESYIDTFQSIEEIADAVGISVDELLEEVAVSCDYEDVEDVDYYDVAKYAEDVYEDEIYQAYLDVVENLDTDYHWNACEIWNGFIKDSNIEVV